MAPSRCFYGATRVDSKQAAFLSWFVTFKGVIRWGEWVSSKMAPIFVCLFYAAWSRDMPAEFYFQQMGPVFVSILAFGAFGYAVNSYSDRVVDQDAGKSNPFSCMSLSAARIWIGALLFVGLVPALWLFRARGDVVLLLMSAYALAALYSLPPVRFKERGFAGLLVSSAAQRTFPAIIVFQALGAWDMVAILLVAVSLLIGVRYMVAHQIHDAEADIQAGVSTALISYGAERLAAIQRHIVCPAEVLLTLSALMMMGLEHPLMQGLLVLYVLWLAVQYVVLSDQRQRRFSAVTYGLFEDLYNFYWPVALGLLLYLEQAAWWPLLFTVLWLFGRLRREVRTARMIGQRLVGALLSRRLP